MLCDAHAYFIYHFDAYQGKHGANIGIPKDINNLATKKSQ